MIDSVMQPIYEKLVGLLLVPIDQIRFMLHLFYIFPFALLNYYINGKTPRLLYGLISGLLLCYNMYGYEIYHIFIDALVTHYFIVYFGRKKSAFWVLLFTLFHISYVHLERMIYDYGGWTLDVSGIYMMSVVKFSAFAFSYEDGGKDDKELVNTYMKEKKIIEEPSLLESLSFTFHYSSCIIGPSIEFADFRNFINQSNEYADIPFNKVVAHVGKRLCYWIVYTVIYLVGTANFPIKFLYSEEFGNKNILYKYVYIYMAGNILRSRFYTGWTLSHCAMSMSGITYGKKGSEEHFNKAICFDYYGVEIEPNPKKKITKWNITVHLWLKYSVFLRLKNVTEFGLFLKSIHKSLEFIAKINPELITFMISAFWHGFYPNYYFFFFNCFLIEQTSALYSNKTYYFEFIENNFNNKGIVGKIVYYALGVFHLNIMNSFGLYFSLIEMVKAWTFQKNTYFSPDIAIIALYLIGKFMPRQKKREGTSDKNEKEPKLDNLEKKDQ